MILALIAARKNYPVPSLLHRGLVPVLNPAQRTVSYFLGLEPYHGNPSGTFRIGSRTSIDGARMRMGVWITRPQLASPRSQSKNNLATRENYPPIRGENLNKCMGW